MNLLRVTLRTDDWMPLLHFDGSDLDGIEIVSMRSYLDDGIPTLDIEMKRAGPVKYRVVNKPAAAVRSVPFVGGTVYGYLLFDKEVVASGQIVFDGQDQWLPIEYPRQPAYMAVVYNGKIRLQKIEGE